MMNKKTIYWICQLFGWGIFIILQVIFFSFTNSLGITDFLNYFFWYLFAIAITHGFRFIILKYKLVRLRLRQQLLAVISGSSAMAIVFVALQFLVARLTLGNSAVFSFESAANSINFAFVFFLWNLIYFSYQYIENYKKAEIDNLRYRAAMNEIELNNLKSQLNPHFMFNAMNSIRALIQENPEKAKDAITMLSNILRNTLQLEKNKLIPLEDEMNLVKDYLSLEKIRYEQRLNYTLDISPAALKCPIPALMLQTLVENGIKHGISKLMEGGVIQVNAAIKNEQLEVLIYNSGQLNNSVQENQNGYGIKNTIQRLKIIFGEKATFQLSNEKEKVCCRLVIPMNA
jgi:two-component system, LytTR family, sensor kinase